MKNFYLKLLFAFSVALFINTNLLAQNYEVKGAGTADVNGIYEPAGKIRGKIKYKKGEYTLFYKGCHAKWMIKSKNGNFYRNKKDSAKPPEKGWEKACGKGSKNPAPIVIPVAEKPKEVKQKKNKSNF